VCPQSCWKGETPLQTSPQDFAFFHSENLAKKEIQNMKKQKSKKRIRDKSIKFFVTEKEKNLIDERAKKCNFSRSELLRKSALETEINITQINGLEELAKFTFELNKLGINLHQIVKKINMDIDDEEDFQDLLSNQENLKKILDNVLEISEKVKEWQQ